MEVVSLALALVLLASVVAGVFLFWRYVWFFRNPERTIPGGDNVVSPADGTVVYVKSVAPGEVVISIKEGMPARVRDIVRQDLDAPKMVIGIFMSPFDVHYNRAPITGTVEQVRHHPARSVNHHMGPMHVRTLFNLHPLYRNSRHVLENERTVTRIRGRLKARDMSCYVVQIAGKSVDGIDVYVPEGGHVTKGEVFGMIRIGSQVDLILPSLADAAVKVRPGDKVYAGQSIIAE